MKKFLKTDGWFVACLLTGLLFGFAGCGGCSTGKGQLNPTSGVYNPDVSADPLVVSVENIRETALGLFDAVMRIEKQNQDILMRLNPKIHVAVEQIRRDGQKALNALTDSKTAYQKSRNTADATTLRNALAALQSLVNSAISNLAQMSEVQK
jgi:hypothetical protein